MITIRRYSVMDHDEVWRIHLLAVGEAGVEPTHHHYNDIYQIKELYLDKGGDFLVGTNPGETVIVMGGLKKLSEDQAEIKRLRVHPAYQKRGYGQLLLTKLEERAAEMGFKQLYLDALTNQHSSHQLFLKNGYKEIGTSTIDGFEVLLFEKNLINES